jgi:hypothetical protein
VPELNKHSIRQYAYSPYFHVNLVYVWESCNFPLATNNAESRCHEATGTV